MNTSYFHYAFGGLVAAAIVVSLFSSMNAVTSMIAQPPATRSGVFAACFIAIASQLIGWVVMRWWKGDRGGAVYGLKHGRLHLQAQTSMWMNMGYWKDATVSTTLSEACRDLLSAVLAEAGFDRTLEEKPEDQSTRRIKCLIDLGIGCGDQTIYLMSDKPIRPSDESWWDAREHCVKFDHYLGITKDITQARYASERITELIQRIDEGKRRGPSGSEEPDVTIFCADAARPVSWDEKLQARVRRSRGKTHECWVLALDTAYHFSPSRWELIEYSHQHLAASFMAFDLCISPTATIRQKLMLRILTTLTNAPWCNFTTAIEYRARLVQAGYHDDRISITDVSENVFTPLAEFLERQDKRLSVMGLGIGTLSIAKDMFAWWGSTGVVRGVIVVARHSNSTTDH